jgi:hypothetical protein
MQFTPAVAESGKREREFNESVLCSSDLGLVVVVVVVVVVGT